MFNPYAQSGWPNSQNPNAGSSRNTVPQPSLFGALPYSTPPAPLVPATLLSFSFSRFTPTILNCTVTGPQSRVYFRIITKFPSGGFTVIQNSENQPVVVIEWLKHPVIEIRDVVSKRPTALWLPLSQTKSHRQMEARGKTFVWVPGGEYIFLVAAGLGQPEIFAQLSRTADTATLELSAEAIRLGLLEICVAATVLLQCGRNID
ncbi:hypothetical protein C8J57DRAFT_533580 [Mycena rebaudengoi]|nr:hypothetical protein C8J57DRAFT_533580 [Mycena rebaudengoi]